VGHGNDNRRLPGGRPPAPSGGLRSEFEDDEDATVVGAFSGSRLPVYGGNQPSSEGSDPTAQFDVSALLVSARARNAEAEAPVEAPVVPVSTIVGRYVMGPLLGKGGMGRVHQARDMKLGREVALKLMPVKVAADADARHVFTAEARALAAAQHPNIIAVYDVLEDAGNLIMVMELVDGQRLDEIILSHKDARKVVEVEQAIELAIQLLTALVHLHERGLVHRDVKPNNIMVDQRGSVRLMDFGLAREEDRMRQKGTLIRGTPSYMSPEQIRGEDLTAATDIYAFGVTLFELLTGELPFPADATGFAQVDEPPARVSTFRPDVEAEVVELIDACLRKERASRPPARDVVRKLLPLAGGGIAYLPPSVLPGMRREGTTLDTVARLERSKPVPPPVVTAPREAGGPPVKLIGLVAGAALLLGLIVGLIAGLLVG